jgi:hypothetical protein
MMRNLGLTVILSAAALSGCSQTLGTQMEYINKVHIVNMPDGDYRIYDHPKGDRLMVAPSLGRIAVQGATLGIAGQTPEQARNAAASQYMAQTGRSHCRVISSRELMKPNVEVVFDCSVKG